MLQELQNILFFQGFRNSTVTPGFDTTGSVVCESRRCGGSVFEFESESLAVHGAGALPWQCTKAYLMLHKPGARVLPKPTCTREHLYLVACTHSTAWWGAAAGVQTVGRLDKRLRPDFYCCLMTEKFIHRMGSQTPCAQGVRVLAKHAVNLESRN
jgi:hypothetical protein